MNARAKIANQEGSTLVISIIILALLTVIGIAVTTTTSIELQIAGNDKIFKENFYEAEGAAMMLARIFENITSGTTDMTELKDDKYPKPSGGYEPMPVKNDPSNDIDVDEIQKDTYWEGTDDKSCEAIGVSSDSAHPAKFLARKEGLAKGSSLGMTSGSRLWEYAIFGRREKNKSATVVQLGYRKRF